MRKVSSALLRYIDINGAFGQKLCTSVEPIMGFVNLGKKYWDRYKLGDTNPDLSAWNTQPLNNET